MDRLLSYLIRERVVRIAWPLVPVGTLLPPLALSLDPEGADVGPVALVVRRGAGQALQGIVLVGGDLTQGARGGRAVALSQLAVGLK